MKASPNTHISELLLTFTKMNHDVYAAIMEEVISGIDRGELKQLLERLDALNLPQYRDLLKTDNLEQFNFYLWNAITDAFFVLCTAVYID